MKTLVVWESVPEECLYYVLDEDTDKDLVDLAVKAAGCYINADDLPEDHPVYKLSDELDVRFPDPPSARSLKAPIQGFFSKVIICGFFL